MNDALLADIDHSPRHFLHPGHRGFYGSRDSPGCGPGGPSANTVYVASTG